ncbi:MAG TPA: zinc-ribbon domain-containing protein [Polyangiaceae bacterium]
MYVQCDRCKTEYDFDDALVSERGTTVKCTNCSHQFRVKRSSSGGDSDRWVVTTASGQDLVFTSLKELQRAILAKLVARTDSLARGNAPPRVLGAIAELEPFFETAEKKPEGVPTARKPFSSRPPPIPGTATQGLAPPKRTRSEPPMRPRVETLRPTSESGNGAVPPPVAVASLPDLADDSTQVGQPVRPEDMMKVGEHPEPSEPETARINAKGERIAPKTKESPVAVLPVPEEPPTEPAPPVRKSSIPPPLPPHVAAPAPAPAVPQRQPSRPPPPPPQAMRTMASSVPPPPQPQASRTISTMPPAARPRPQPQSVARTPVETDALTSPLPPATRPVRRMASIDDEVDSLPVSAPPGRVGGWLFAALLLLPLGAFGAFIAKPYLVKGVAPAASAQPLDPRTQQFLASGEAALLQGDLDGAKESFDKASALAEKDPRVLLPVARLATIRADVPWLKQRLLAPAGVTLTAAQQADVTANKAQLDDLAARAKKASDDLVAVSPDDPAALRVRVDALRIAGDRDAARALVGKVATNASQPDTAYVLGALDLAELDPPWSVVLERLRTAAAGEAGLGRARAALAYALARSGDASQARQETDRLAALAHPPPLVAQLRAYIEASPGARDGGVAAMPTSVDVSKLPTAAADVGAGGGGGGGGGMPSDPRVMLSQADSARQKKDYSRARTLYEAALAKNPSDSEALAGLGDVSHDERDLQGAQSFYKKATDANPTFLPALIGEADVTWELNDRSGAQKQYKEITERFPEGSYPARVKQRAQPPDEAPAPTGASTSDTPANGSTP